MMTLKKGKVKYAGIFNKVYVVEKSTGKVYLTKCLGIDEYERGKVVSHVYDMIYGRDISDTKEYEIHLVEKNVFGFGGTKVKPLYFEAGWKHGSEN